MNVHLEVIQNVGLIVIDHPPVNVLTSEIAESIIAHLDRVEEDNEIVSVVLTANGRTFVAGADVRKFQRMIQEGECHKGAELYRVTNRLENCTKPVVCAMFGTVLGGGLELAMACHHRIALAGSRIGQPEVKLGLIPGAGGTQRLPRLCGVATAAELCALGNPIDAQRGLELGIVDKVVSSDLRDAAIQLALRMSNETLIRTRDRSDKITTDSSIRESLDEIRKQARVTHQGAEAGLRAIQAIESGIELPFEDGLTLENELFVQSLESDEARNLIRLFFAERQAARIDGIGDGMQPVDIVSVRFPYLDEADVFLVESLLRSRIDIQIDDPDDSTAFQLFFVRDTTPKFIQRLAATDSIICLTGSEFDFRHLVDAGANPEKIIGVKWTNTYQPFVEIGVSEQTCPGVIASLAGLLRKMKIGYIIEKPDSEYVSTRIKRHRLDESDLKIEAWKLYQEKIVRRLDDIDLININCFGQPRHLANLGEAFESTST